MKKKIVYATMIMSTVALVSTGFAAWIIAGNDTETQGGQIAVDTVSDVRRMISEFKWTDSTFANSLAAAPKVVFGGPEKQTGDSWISGGTANGVENLSLYATFKVQNSVVNEVFDGFDDIFTSITIKSNAQYDAAFTEGLVDELPTIDFTSAGENTSLESALGSDDNRDTKISIAYDSTNDLYKLSIVLDWGSGFEYQNPYHFYSGEYSETKGEDAKKKLGKLESLQGATYTLEIKTKAGA